MSETRQRGTDKGDVVTEELRDGVWHVVPAIANSADAALVAMLESVGAVVVDVSADAFGDTMLVPLAKPRRGRPPRVAA